MLVPHDDKRIESRGERQQLAVAAIGGLVFSDMVEILRHSNANSEEGAING